jgi:hypothetical protein
MTSGAIYSRPDKERAIRCVKSPTRSRLTLSSYKGIGPEISRARFRVDQGELIKLHMRTHMVTEDESADGHPIEF